LNLYETTIIIDSILKPDDVRGLKDRICNFISNNGGEIVKVEEWGKRRLAYEINKKQYGFYEHVRFTAPSALVGLLEREYRLNESVLRYLTVKVDRRALQKEQDDLQKQKAAAAAVVEVESEIPVVAAPVDVFPETPVVR